MCHFIHTSCQYSRHSIVWNPVNPTQCSCHVPRIALFRLLYQTRQFLFGQLYLCERSTVNVIPACRSLLRGHSSLSDGCSPCRGSPWRPPSLPNKRKRRYQTLLDYYTYHVGRARDHYTNNNNNNFINFYSFHGAHNRKKRVTPYHVIEECN